MTTPLERDVERKLRAYCKEVDVLCLKFTSPGHAGVPDRMLIAEGRVAFLELKRPGCKPTALQYRTLEQLRARGVWAGWVNSTWNAGAAARAVATGDKEAWREAVR